MVDSFVRFMDMIYVVFRFPLTIGGFTFSWWDVFLFTWIAPMVIAFLLSLFNHD